MRIVILNGTPEGNYQVFDDYMKHFEIQLSVKHQVRHYHLKDMELRHCTGCWNCWTKTPGRCCLRDEAEDIMRAIIHSDLLVMASPVIAGFTSALLKKISDRCVMLLHPYIKIIHGEYHHRKRYKKYPDLGVIIQTEPGMIDEDIRIIENIYRRFSLNFHARLRFFHTVSHTFQHIEIYETIDI